MSRAVRDALPAAKGHILCFLPGAREIDNTIAELRGIDARVLPLHGSLDVDAQEQAPRTARPVPLATSPDSCNPRSTRRASAGLSDPSTGHKVGSATVPAAPDPVARR